MTTATSSKNDYKNYIDYLNTTKKTIVDNNSKNSYLLLGREIKNELYIPNQFTNVTANKLE